MKKHSFTASQRRRYLSFTAIALLIGICVSCTSPDPAADPDADSDRSSSKSTSAVTTTLSTDADASTVPSPILDPETEQAIETFRAVMEATPRDTQYISVYDLTYDRLLYTTGEEQRVYPASTSKLITILYALTVAGENDIFTVGNELDFVPYDSSKAWISVGQQFTVRDLVAAMLLPSGNDAAYTLAVGCGRMKAEDDSLSAAEALAFFMDGLNAYASELGLEDSHFVTPDGYHDPDHYTTLADMAKIAAAAYENALMREIMAMTSYTAKPLNFGKELTWQNTNRLLTEDGKYYVEGANGMKTGSHSDAGACLVATAERNGRTLLVLLFKGSDSTGRFTEAKSILELCFATIEA